MPRTLVLSSIAFAMILGYFLWPNASTPQSSAPSTDASHAATPTIIATSAEPAPPSVTRTQLSTHPSASYKNFLPKRFLQAEQKLGNNPNDPAQLAEESSLLRDMNLTEQDAILHIHTILHSCRGIANQGHFPTGENVEITNFLLGENARRIAYLPDDHPRITADGELADKWGTPYFFHFLSSKNVEIQSAGPDKEMHTDDDILLDL